MAAVQLIHRYYELDIVHKHDLPPAHTWSTPGGCHRKQSHSNSLSAPGQSYAGAMTTQIAHPDASNSACFHNYGAEGVKAIEIAVRPGGDAAEIEVPDHLDVGVPPLRCSHQLLCSHYIRDFISL